MSEFLEAVKELLEKSYVFIPSIMAVISAIGIPSLVSIGKIVSNAKVYLQSAKTLKEAVGAITDTFQLIIDDLKGNYEAELKELELEKQLAFNPKQKELIQAKIERISACVVKYGNMSVKELVNKAMEKVPTKKVKVKVIK